MRFTGRFFTVLLVALIFMAVRPVLAASSARMDGPNSISDRSVVATSVASSDAKKANEVAAMDYRVSAAATTPTPTATAQNRAAPQGIALLPTPTPGAKNPATVRTLDLMDYMLRGAVITLAVFGVLGLYVAIRNLFRDR